MAVCLDYQSVYAKKEKIIISVRMQVIAALLLLISLIAKVWANVESTDLGYQLARERQQAIAYDMERRELELQLSVLLRPDNLGKRAKKALGMEPLDASRTRKIMLSE